MTNKTKLKRLVRKLKGYENKIRYSDNYLNRSEYVARDIRLMK
jgi:hypothetical protein